MKFKNLALVVILETAIVFASLIFLFSSYMNLEHLAWHEQAHLAVYSKWGCQGKIIRDSLFSAHTEIVGSCNMTESMNLARAMNEIVGYNIRPFFFPVSVIAASIISLLTLLLTLILMKEWELLKTFEK